MEDKRIGTKLVMDTSDYEQKIARSKAALSGLQVVSRNTSHSMVTDVQATSGALRLMEGGMTGNIRAAERFLASIKGVGAAMKLIYPAVGLIAVGAVLAKGVAELTNFIKKTKEAGAEFRASFQEMQNSARLSNDELAKTNINLENQIAKLTGKHENVLASELIEARIQADHLADSAAAAAKQIKDLLEKNQAGFLDQSMGAGPTKEVFGNIENFQNLKSQARQDQSDAQHKGDKKGADAADARYKQLLKNERAYLLQQREFRSGTGDRDGAFAGDQSKNLTAINAALDLNYDQSDRTDLIAKNVKDAAAVKKAQDAKDFSEAQRTAATKQMGGYDKEFKKNDASLVPGPDEEDNQFNVRKLTEEARFWAQKLEIAKQGSLVYQDIQEKLAEIDVRANQQYATAVNEHIKLMKEQQKFITESFADDLDLTRNSDTTKDLTSSGKDAVEMLSAMHEGVTIARSNADAWKEAQIQIGLAAGTISKYDAAVQTMQLHQRQNDTANGDLAAHRADLTARYGPKGTNSSPEAQAAWNQLDNQQAQLDGQNRVQSAQEQQNVNEQTPFGAWKGALDQFVQQSRDTAAQVKDIWSSALSSVNDELVKIISTRHNYGLRQTFGNLGAGMFRNVASAGLQKGEGALLGALGFGGKPDGSASKPLHVIIAGALGAASAAGGLFSKAASGASGVGDLVSGGVKAAASHAGGIMSTIGGLFSGLGFADGGDPPVGKMSIVGEKGIEGFVPKTAGTIIPNHMLGGGGSVTHNWSVDARGATDPAATTAAVNRAIYKAQPALTAASMNASRESNARKNPAARR